MVCELSPLVTSNLDFNDFAARGTTDVERYKKQNAEFKQKANLKPGTVPAKQLEPKKEEPEDEEEDEDEYYDSMDYGDEFNDEEERDYKR